MNRALVGRRYDAPPVRVDQRSIQAFARATDDLNPRYLERSRPGRIVAPPMYVVRLHRDLLFRVVLDPELGADALRLLHGEQEMRFLAPIRPLDTIWSWAEIAGIADKTSGQILTLHVVSCREGEVVTDTVTSLFIRSRRPPTARQETRPTTPEHPWSFIERLRVARDQSLRYAAASLDNNPVHLSHLVARAAGLRGVVLQGLCTMAFCCRAVVNRVAEGDPTRLRQLRVRFARPVYPGDELAVQGIVNEADGAVIDFRVINDRAEEVIQGGRAQVVR